LQNTRERAQSFPTDDHIEHIVKAYQSFKEEPGFTHVATLDDLRAKDGNLSIPLYVAPVSEARQDQAGYATGGEHGLEKALADWLESSGKVRQALTVLLDKSG
jgi:type I restriction enzyme M protein